MNTLLQACKQNFSAHKHDMCVINVVRIFSAYANELRQMLHTEYILTRSSSASNGPAEGCIKIGIKPRVTLGRVLSHFTQELL